MPNIITTDFDYTWIGKVVPEIFADCPSVQDSIDWRRVFRILPNVKYKQELHLTQPLDKIVKKYQSCARTFTGTTPITNRTLTTTNMEINAEFCVDVLDQTVLVELLKQGIDRNNVEGTEIYNIITRLILDGKRRDLMRILFFADTSSLSDDYDMIDGVWATLLAETDYCVPKTTITALNQTEGTRALDWLRTISEGADVVLKQVPARDKVYLVTPNFYENLMTTYENSALTGGGLTARVENGVTTLMFRGTDVIAMYEWQTALEDPDNPLYNTVNTLVLYTTPDNHVIGTDRLSDTERIDGWYERKDRKTYFEGQFMLGYNFVCCELQAIGTGNI